MEENTIFEEENEHAHSAAEPYRQKLNKSKADSSAAPVSKQSKNLTKKQQALVKQTQIIYGNSSNQPQQPKQQTSSSHFKEKASKSK